MVSLPKTGKILREYWTNLPGKEVDDLIDSPLFPNRPSGRDFAQSFEVRAKGATNYGCRLVGYLHPPITGDYTFWISASPHAALNLSLSENPGDAIMIFLAGAPDVKPGEWERKSGFARTKSLPIKLIAGRRYYIEAIHKAGDDDGHLAIAWTPPGGEREIISGEYLSPYKPTGKERKR